MNRDCLVRQPHRVLRIEVQRPIDARRGIPLLSLAFIIERQQRIAEFRRHEVNLAATWAPGLTGATGPDKLDAEHGDCPNAGPGPSSYQDRHGRNAPTPCLKFAADVARIALLSSLNSPASDENQTPDHPQTAPRGRNPCRANL